MQYYACSFWQVLGITLYPAFSDWYISHHQGQVIEDYDEKAAQMSQKELKKELDKAHIYNTQLLGNVVLTDPFDADAMFCFDRRSGDLGQLRLRDPHHQPVATASTARVGITLASCSRP